MTAGTGSSDSRVRIQKILAAAGFASRRGAEDFLRQGRVTVNGATARLGELADPFADLIALDGEPVHAERKAYWIAHKPIDVLTTASDSRGRRTVLELLPDCSQRLFPVGRLDRDSEGLVILTNDGAISQTLLHPSFGCEREYRVTVEGRVSQQSVRKLERGIVLDGRRTASAQVGQLRFDPRKETTTFSLVLREGKKRQIRRSMQMLRHRVVRLLRVRMGPIRLGRLPSGRARPLQSSEVRRLHEHVQSLIERRLSGS